MTPPPTTLPLTDRLVVATATGLHRFTPDGEALSDQRVDAVVADGRRLWALVERRHLHRIDTDGTRLIASIDAGSATCLGVHHGTVWAGGDNARVWRLDSDTLTSIATFDDAPTHERWSTPWGGPPAVFSIAGPGDDLYVSVHVGGILRTSDHGANWVDTIDLDTDVHQVAVATDGTVWAATGTSGLGESRDRGATWRFHTDGLHATYLLAVTVTDDGPLVSAASGHAGTDGALYRFDGHTFHRCMDGLPGHFDGAVQPRHLAADGTVVVAALPGGDVVASTDSGRTWTHIASEMPDISDLALTVR